MALITTGELSMAAQVLIDIAPSYEFAAGVAALAVAKGATVRLPVPSRETAEVIDATVAIAQSR